MLIENLVKEEGKIRYEEKKQAGKNPSLLHFEIDQTERLEV